MAENYQLKWHSHGAYLHKTVATLRKSRSFTDVTLCTVEGKSMPAHRFILSACSKYFDKVLKQSYAVPPPMYPLLIVLPAEVTYRTLGILLRYMYCGEATVPNDQLPNVLKAGDILQIRGLYQETKEGDSQNIKMDDVISQQFSNRKKSPDGKYQNNGKSSEKPNNNHVERERKQNVMQVYRSTIKKASSKVDHMNNAESTDIIKMEQDEEEEVEAVVMSHTQVVNLDYIKNSIADDDLPSVIQNGPETQITVKDEPIDWQDFDESNDYDAHLTIQPEVSYASTDDQDDTESQFYAPLVCDICHETFTSPSLWVRHAKTHENLTNSSANKKIKSESFDDNGDSNSSSSEAEYKALRCELCQEVYSSPSEWVQHIEETHTNEQLAMTNIILSQDENSQNFNQNENQTNGGRSSGGRRKCLRNRLLCLMCNKTFPSQASIMIHIRSHTGEKPYHCTVCEKGFNVKSNLLRHMRTLHDSIVMPDTVFKQPNSEAKDTRNFP